MFALLSVSTYCIIRFPCTFQPPSWALRGFFRGFLSSLHFSASFLALRGFFCGFLRSLHFSTFFLVASRVFSRLSFLLALFSLLFGRLAGFFAAFFAPCTFQPPSRALSGFFCGFLRSSHFSASFLGASRVFSADFRFPALSHILKNLHTPSRLINLYCHSSADVRSEQHRTDRLYTFNRLRMRVTIRVVGRTGDNRRLRLDCA